MTPLGVARHRVIGRQDRRFFVLAKESLGAYVVLEAFDEGLISQVAGAVGDAVERSWRPGDAGWPLQWLQLVNQSLFELRRPDAVTGASILALMVIEDAFVLAQSGLGVAWRLRMGEVERISTGRNVAVEALDREGNVARYEELVQHGLGDVPARALGFSENYSADVHRRAIIPGDRVALVMGPTKMVRSVGAVLKDAAGAVEQTVAAGGGVLLEIELSPAI
jgi:hypothetical protein